MTEYSRVFLDTSPIIYYLQQEPTYFERTKEILYALRLSGASFVSSDITIAEYCVFPFREDNLSLVDALKGFVNIAGIEIVHTSEQIALEAAHIRAEYAGFKAMDSLQLAMAVISDCDLFLTNDKQLRRFSKVKCVTIDEFVLT